MDTCGINTGETQVRMNELASYIEDQLLPYDPTCFVKTLIDVLSKLKESNRAI